MASRWTSAAQGQAVTYRFVVTVPGLYVFQEQSTADPPSIQIEGQGVDRSLDPTGTNDTQLVPGRVLAAIPKLRITDSALVRLFLRLGSDQTEIVLANGVGQGPALSLRLISFSGAAASTPVGGPCPGPCRPATRSQRPCRFLAGTASAVPCSLEPGAMVWQDRSPTVQAGGVSFLSLTTDLVGRPTGTTPYAEAFPSGSALPGRDFRRPAGFARGHRRGDSVPVERPAIRLDRLSGHDSGRVTRELAPTRQAWWSSTVRRESRRRDGCGNGPSGRRRIARSPGSCRGPSGDIEIPLSGPRNRTVDPRSQPCATGPQPGCGPGRRSRMTRRGESNALDPARVVAAGGHPFRGRHRPVLLAVHALVESEEAIGADGIEPRDGDGIGSAFVAGPRPSLERCQAARATIRPETDAL